MLLEDLLPPLPPQKQKHRHITTIDGSVTFTSQSAIRNLGSLLTISGGNLFMNSLGVTFPKTIVYGGNVLTTQVLTVSSDFLQYGGNGTCSTLLQVVSRV